MKNLRKITAILLAIACSTATAQFAGGDGSAGNPYQIATTAQLDSIREDGSENFLDNHYVLTQDLDFDGYTYADGDLGWQPIAPDTSSASNYQGGKFTGSFNGRGFAIHNLKINRPTQDYVGLFGYLDSSTKVDSLGIEAMEVSGRAFVGGLAGVHIGGMIASSYATGQLEGNTSVGGLVGGSTGTFSASYAAVEVTASGNNIGGLVGRLTSSGVIENSYATGSVQAKPGANVTGGLVGDNEGTIRNSYATGQVRGDTNVGGLVGNNEGTIQYSYAVGQVSGTANVGSLVGRNESGTYVSNYWNTETSGQDVGVGGADNPEGVMGLSTSEMYAEASFVSWNFTDIWLPPANEAHFPLLRGLHGQQYVSIVADATSVNEGTQATFTLERSGVLLETIDVTVSLAEIGIFLESTASTSVAFAEGATTATLYINTEDDDTDEEDGSITATIEDGTGYVIITSKNNATVAITDNDLPIITIAPEETSITEGEDAIFTLTRAGLTINALTVDVRVTESGGPFIASSLPTEVTFVATRATATIRLNTEGDEMDEDNGIITVTVESGAAYALGTPSVAEISVEDDDGVPDPEITIVADETTVEEGTSATFTLERRRPDTDALATAGELSVMVSVTQMGEYTSGTAPESVTFADGSSTATLYIDTEDDDMDEEDGTITATITLGTGYSIGDPNEATVNLTDNDLPKVTIAAEEASITEGEDAVFTLTRAGLTTEALSVTISTTQVRNFATSNLPTSVRFSATEATVTLTIPTTDDTEDTPSGQITVTIKSGMEYEVGMDSTATVAIADNDGAPDSEITIAAGTSPIAEGTSATFTLTRRRPDTDDLVTLGDLSVQVSVTETGEYISGTVESVTFTDGASTVMLTINTQNDEVDESDGIITATVSEGVGYTVGTSSSAEVAITDNDLPIVTIAAGTSPVAEGMPAVFTLTRAGLTTIPLTVDVSITENGAFIEGMAPTSVMFVSGSSTVTLTIDTEDDNTDEENGNITATIANGTGYSTGTPSSAEVTITDNDLPTITIAAGTSPVAEGMPAVFTLTRAGLTTIPLTVDVSITENGAFIEGMAPTSVMFVSGSSTFTLTINTEDDNTDEENGSITATIADGTGYSTGTPSSAEVTITDNDLPAVTIAAGTSPVTEGTSATFALTRTTRSGDLTVSVEVTEQGSYIDGIAPMSVSFTDGSLTATLTINTKDDDTDETDGTITATVKDGDDYTVGDPSSAEVTITDNDDPPVGIFDESGVVLYPNPVERYLYVRLPQGGQVSVYTLSGRRERTYRIKPGEESTPLDVSALSAGIYVVKLTDNTGESSHYRVVKE